jgi:sialate O-acetylesterase
MQLHTPIRGIAPLVIFFTTLLTIETARGDVRLPAIFGDHMVLQQKQPIRIWGWAAPQEVVTVTMKDSKGIATADASGRWETKLAPMPASSDPTMITVQGTNKLEIKDVLVGEVWLCSGQSNMEWSVAASSNPQDEIAAANFPLIRHVKVPLTASVSPLEDFQAAWQICSPETAAGFTACGYFMARHLHRELNVPIGLVNASWGGTRIEPWTPPVGFQKVDALQGIYQSVLGRTPGTPPYQERLAEQIRLVEAWTMKAKLALDAHQPVAPTPPYPPELAQFTSNQDPTMLYNGMIHPIVGFPIRGAIWYQGESNHDDGMLYLEKKKGLIGGWRELWGQGNFPFYYVQIAPFRYGDPDPTTLAKFWEAQAAAKSIPNTGMVVINDIATVGDIHPPNKQDVGYRLALLALKNDYGKADVVAESPESDRVEPMGDKLRIRFKNAAGGLKTRDGKAPSHFEIIGEGSGGFRPATATIDGNSVLLSSAEVKMPVAARFAWNMLAEPNLTGGTGLPVGAFRIGNPPDFAKSVPGASAYSLVYDFDLAKLQANPPADIDLSDSIKPFDRVAYLIELTAADGCEQALFVSMDAFTDDVKKIGIPTFASGARFQIPVNSLDVFSNVPGITEGTAIATGNIEFWPDNYGAVNGVNVEGASDTVYDFGDELAPPADGYGSMQVHDRASGQTFFAVNHWRAGNGADLGIGNSPGNTRDWTFTSNAGSYTAKRLRVLVRQK